MSKITITVSEYNALKNEIKYLENQLHRQKIVSEVYGKASMKKGAEINKLKGQVEAQRRRVIQCKTYWKKYKGISESQAKVSWSAWNVLRKKVRELGGEL